MQLNDDHISFLENEKPGSRDRIIVILIYLLHHPDTQTGTHLSFSKNLKNNNLKNIPKSLAQQPHINTSWNKMIENKLIIPLPNQQKIKLLKYQVNPEVISNILFKASNSSIDHEILKWYLKIIPKISISPNKTLIQINKIKSYNINTFLLYLSNIFRLFQEMFTYGYTFKEKAHYYNKMDFLNFFICDQHIESSLLLHQWLDNGNNYDVLIDLFYIHDSMTKDVYGRSDNQIEIIETIDDTTKDGKLIIKNEIENNRITYQNTLKEYFITSAAMMINKINKSLLELLNKNSGLDGVFDY